MGIIDELRSTLGDDLGRPSAPSAKHNWLDVCCCGHLSRYHSASVGGDYQLPAPGTKIQRDVVWATVTQFTGCVGAMDSRAEDTTIEVDRANLVMTTTLLASCPCTEMRPIAKVDRPNRFFNQRMPATDRRTLAGHPFTVGCRALSTHLSRRRAALTDPTWPDAEFNRRLVWIDGARVCGISSCKATDDVWPVFVHDDRSELRCAAHR